MLDSWVRACWSSLRSYTPPVQHGLDVRLVAHEHVIEVDHHIDAEDYLQIAEEP